GELAVRRAAVGESEDVLTAAHGHLAVRETRVYAAVGLAGADMSPALREALLHVPSRPAQRRAACEVPGAGPAGVLRRAPRGTSPRKSSRRSARVPGSPP